VTRAEAQKILARPRFVALVSALISLSAVLTVAEAAVDRGSSVHRWMNVAHLFISAVFIVELAIRFRSFGKKHKFFREHWQDVLSLLPLVPPFPAFPLMRLLRLLRLMTLFDIVRRQRGLLPYSRKRGMRELLLVLGLVIVAITVGSAGMLTFEHDTAEGVRTFDQAFWFNVYSLISAQPIPNPPVTLGGRIVSLGVVLMGPITFATLAGTMAAYIAEGIRSEGTTVDWDDLHDHIIICGWNRKAELIVAECRAAGKLETMPIVCIAETEGQPPFADPSLRPFVQFIHEDFTKVEALEKAGVRRASRCIILSDLGKGRRERDADARTILAALTIEKLNPAIYTCAEINRREYISHLEMGNVNDYVVGGEHSAFLLAQAALNPGVMSVFTELLSYNLGNRFHRCKVGAKWKGKRFFDLLVHLKEKHDAILIAVEKSGGKVLLNPKDYEFDGSEDLVMIASREVRI
jgi:voltage-gated potassium channel